MPVIHTPIFSLHLRGKKKEAENGGCCFAKLALKIMFWIYTSKRWMQSPLQKFHSMHERSTKRLVLALDLLVVSHCKIMDTSRHTLHPALPMNAMLIGVCSKRKDNFKWIKSATLNPSHAFWTTCRKIVFIFPHVPQSNVQQGGSPDTCYQFIYCT